MEERKAEDCVKVITRIHLYMCACNVRSMDLSSSVFASNIRAGMLEQTVYTQLSDQILFIQEYFIHSGCYIL